MKAYKGDVVYLTEKMCRKFPEASSRPFHRPFLVVSNDTGNAMGGLLIIVPLTMKHKAMHMPTHCEVGERSVALCEQIYTVGQEDVSEISWKASSQDMTAIDRCLKASLGLRRCTIADIFQLPTKKAR